MLPLQSAFSTKMGRGIMLVYTRLSASQILRLRNGPSYLTRFVHSFSHRITCLNNYLRPQATQAIIKETVAGRKNTSPQNIYEIGQLYAAGALKVACIGLQCVSFNNTMYKALLEHAEVFARTRAREGYHSPSRMVNSPAFSGPVSGTTSPALSVGPGMIGTGHSPLMQTTMLQTPPIMAGRSSAGENWSGSSTSTLVSGVSGAREGIGGSGTADQLVTSMNGMAIGKPGILNINPLAEIGQRK
jgi:hypothetical protein